VTLGALGLATAATSRTVHVEIDPDSPDHPFSYWSTRRGDWHIPSGFFKVSVGRSAGDLEDSEPVLVLRTG
jgi:hypothetical protein